ncbi:Hypothetical protein A7982_06696 [Minicystis rosea]|nr:Hypothetical protein A7982_06696 [Minicystis rosea]
MPRRRARMRRVAAVVAWALGLAVVFALAFAGAVILHLGLPTSRRLLAEQVNAALAKSFQGTIRVQRIGVLRSTRIGGVDVEILDPEGKRALAIHDLCAEIHTLALLRSLRGSGPVVVSIPALSVGGLDALIEKDRTGQLTLSRALSPRAPSAGPGRGSAMTMSSVHLGHGWIHGHLDDAPIIDVDVDDLEGSLHASKSDTAVNVDRLLVRSRGLDGLSPKGAIEARVSLPASPTAEKRMQAQLEGRLGEVPIRLAASIDGKDVAAFVEVPETSPEALASLAPGRLHLGAPASARVDVRGRLPVLSPEIHARIGEGEITGIGTIMLPEEARPELMASLHLALRNLDASVVQKGAPRSRLSADIDASLDARPGAGFSGDFEVADLAGEVNGHAVPAARIHGDFTDRSVEGEAHVAEPGAPARVHFSLQPRAGEKHMSLLVVDAETTIADLGRVSRLGGKARGRAHLDLEGSVDLDTKQVSAEVRGDASGIEAKGLRLARGSVAIAVEGTASAPRIAADVQATGLRVGRYDWSDLRAHARGAPNQLEISAQATGDARSPSATARAHVTGRRARAEIHATLADAGRLDISTTEIHLGGAPTSPSSWKAATGAATIAGEIDLGRLFPKLPEALRPVQSMAGEVTIHGRIARASSRSSPGLEVEASTRDLAIFAKPHGGIAAEKAPWHTTGLDGSARLRLEEATGNARITVDLHDAQGRLAVLDAGARLPISALLRSPSRLHSLLGEAPIEARIDVPRRSLDRLPPALGQIPLHGDVELAAVLRGTARDPRLIVNAWGTSLFVLGTSRCVRPLDVEASLGYDGRRAEARLTATDGGREVMTADALVHASASQAMKARALAWDASGEIALSRFPLDLAGALLQRPIAGEVSGKIAVADLHRAARLEADLDLRDLSLDRADIPKGSVRVDMENGSLDAAVRLQQRDGHLAASARGAVSWGKALVPSLDLGKAADLVVEAQNFRADAAMPFIQGIVTELDGRIDTNTKIHIEPGGRNGTMDGAVVLREGVFEVPQIGERFHAARGTVIMRPWGTIRFDDFAAQGPTGAFMASGQAVLRGLALDHAMASIHIPRGESLPIAVEGMSLGRAYGNVVANARMTPDGRRLDVVAVIPVLHVELPRSTGRPVQRLEPDETIHVGVHAGGEFEAIALGPWAKPRAPTELSVHVTVNLGDDVQLRRDPTVAVMIEGQPIIDVTDKTRVSGQINITRGRLELQGKQFTIERGVVSFVGDDPSDPLVLATAAWDGPDGTRVFADYAGRVKSGRMTLRSEPPRTQDEILALILFGSPDGSFGAAASPGQQESTGARVATVAGGVLAQGLNKALSSLTGTDITARIDTSAAGNPRPELEVQLSRNVSARIGYKLGVPAPGQNPDRTELTLDWRIIRNWSLTAVVGDQGSTSLDMMWRKRY